ncbi:MAG TPA: class I SAM-dependent methyltransferase [Bryobacteraceae bacterium]|nr:class I SAM-dependent methyltransferase [Bryobacteraceae bacterium]
MNLRSLQKQWDSFGLEDPLRAILACAEVQDRPWDTARFFQSGVVEIDSALQYAESIHRLGQKKSALDFGCGVGRLTQALAAHFDRVCGVDLSPAMIQHARRYNRQGDRCEYILNESGDLRRFPGDRFDFIYSSLTLQHMPPRFAARYIAEFLRILSPAGLLLFQLPSRRRGPLGWLRSGAPALLASLMHPFAPRAVMRGIPKQKVIRLLSQPAGEILDIAADQSAGPAWESFRYLVKKAAARS